VQPATDAAPVSRDALGLEAAEAVGEGIGDAVGGSADFGVEGDGEAWAGDAARDAVGSTCAAGVPEPMHAETTKARETRSGRRDRRYTEPEGLGALDRGRVTTGRVARVRRTPLPRSA